LEYVLALHVQSQERCKALLEELTAKSQLSTDALYATAMDEEAIEQTGVKPMKPLLDTIDRIEPWPLPKPPFGEQLGQLYCDENLDEECKTQAHAVVESVRSALEERLGEGDWRKMDSTRLEALKKMSWFCTNIGYPDQIQIQIPLTPELILSSAAK
jgi:predicted metalloendopeptidase